MVESADGYELKVNVGGREVVVPDRMGPDLYRDIVKATVVWWFTDNKHPLTIDNVEHDHELIKDLGADSVGVTEFVMTLEDKFTDTGLFGKIELKDPLIEVSRSVRHMRDAFNLQVNGNVDVANTWIRGRIATLKERRDSNLRKDEKELTITSF